MYLWHLTHTLVFARRKIVSLFLLPALFLLAQAGPGLFKILLHRHYVVMQHATARKSDTILLLSAEEWAAVREVKPGEVSIQGRLFDVRNLSKKRNGGYVYDYTVGLQKKSGGEVRESAIQFKFTWKNGGQAVQNLNFLVVSA